MDRACACAGISEWGISVRVGGGVLGSVMERFVTRQCGVNTSALFGVLWVRHLLHTPGPPPVRPNFPHVLAWGGQICLCRMRVLQCRLGAVQTCVGVHAMPMMAPWHRGSWRPCTCTPWCPVIPLQHEFRAILLVISDDNSAWADGGQKTAEGTASTITVTV